MSAPVVDKVAAGTQTEDMPANSLQLSLPKEEKSSSKMQSMSFRRRKGAAAGTQTAPALFDAYVSEMVGARLSDWRNVEMAAGNASADEVAKSAIAACNMA